MIAHTGGGRLPSGAPVLPVNGGVDTLILAALQLNGRASWGQIARVLDIPERTVTRRGQRLVEAGRVRISTYLDVTRVSEARGLLVRLHTTAAAAPEVAAALAARDDVSSVSMLEGSGDIISLLLPTSQDAWRSLVHTELLQLPGLISFDVSTVLRLHRAGYDWEPGVLSPRQVAQLRPAYPPVEERAHVVALEPEDHELIRALEADGRATVASLATVTGVSAQTVRKRLDALFGQGALHVRTEFSPHELGLEVEAIMWLKTPAQTLDEVATALAAHHAVRFCATATGTATLFLDVLVADLPSLYAFLREDVGRFDRVEIAEVRLVTTPVRRGPLLVSPARERERSS